MSKKDDGRFDYMQKKEKKKSKKGLVIGIIAVVAVIAIVGGSGDSSDKKDSDSSKKEIVAVDSSEAENGKKEIKGDDDSEETKSEDTTEKSDDDKEETKTEENVETIDEQVLWEVDGVKITATGITDDSIWGKEISVLVENNSEKDVGIGADAVIVNDYMISDLTSMSVSAGKKSNDSIDLFSSELEAAGIDKIGKIELYLHTYDPDTYETLEKSGCITITTSNADDYDTETNIEGATLYDKNDIKIIGKYVDEDSFWGTSVVLYIENNSDKNVHISAEDVSVNGYMMNASQYAEVYAGKKIIDEITLFQSDLDDNGITSVDEVETEFEIYDDDYNTIDNSGKVSFTTK